MKYFIQLILSVCVLQLSLYSQNRSWKAEALDRSFVKNEGQFEDINNKEVLFQTATLDFKVFFLKNEIVFEYAKLNTAFIEKQKELIAEKEREEKEGIEEEHSTIRPDTKKLTYKFKKTSNNLTINGIEEQSHHYTYGKYSSIKAKTFNKIIYKNLYDNIDLVFYLPKEGGLKYEYIIHPNGNPNDINIQFPNEFEASINEDGNLNYQFEDDIFNLQDKNPNAYLQGNKKEIPIKYNLNKNNITFKTGKYPNNETLIIDPWVTISLPIIPDTTLTVQPPQNQLVIERYLEFFDVESDFDGNVYARVIPDNIFFAPIRTHIRKYDNNGTLLWVYNPISPYTWGDFSINKQSGTAFLMTNGFFEKINGNTGLMIDSGRLISPTLNRSIDEGLRMRYNHCNDSLFITTGSTQTLDDRCLLLDTNLNSLSPILQGPAVWDHMSFDLGLNSKYSYQFIAKPSGGGVNEFDSIWKIDIANKRIVWRSRAFLGLYEGFIKYEIVKVYPPGFQIVNAGLNLYNGTAVGFNYVYLYNGHSIVQFDINNGNINNNVNILSPNNLSVGHRVDYTNIGGIDIDKCGRLFVNNFGEIQVYDSSVTRIATINTADDTLNDIEIGENELLYVAGKNHIEQIDYSNVIPLNMSFTTTPDSCNLCVGTATITSANCSSLDSLDIFWPKTGQMGQTATGLCEGWHTVELTGGCFSALNVIRDSVFVSASIQTCSFNIQIPNDTICLGECDSLIATPFANDGNVTYQWDNGFSDTDSVISICPTVTTTFRAIGTDTAGNIDTAFATVTVVPVPVVNLGNDTTICNSSLVLDAQNPNASYTWSDNSTNQMLTVTTSGTYWVEVNNGGCIVRDTINITVLSPNANILGNDTVLCSQNSFTITANSQGPYLWNTNATSSSITINTSGQYWVEINNAGCIVRDTINILFDSAIANFQANPTQGCVPLEVQFQDLSQGNINAWNWDFGDGNTDNTQNPNHTYTNSGTYDVKLIVSTNQGCVDSITQTQYIQAFVRAQANFTFSPSTINQNGTVNFINQSQNANSWKWYFGDGDSSILENPDHIYNATGQYTITLIANTNNGCADTIQYTLVVGRDNIIFAPNVITPDGNEINDDWFIVNADGLEDFQVTIYNRWGEVIFETTNPNQVWDASYKGTLVPDGVYIWKATFKNPNEPNVQNITGHITVIK